MNTSITLFPIRKPFCSTLLSLGEVKADIFQLLNPITAISSGTFRPMFLK